ncbi:MAG: methyltransferase domain-containing protein [Rhodospirillales bacterium]|nr:methyltransferase domain-containing protein [Rhodospirillales bacterium]MBO6785350.1 methyltransferase domain-containing protein [Rhodospirillales bacterium]
MWSDVVDLREFYARRLGRTAQRMVRRRLRQLWPDATGLRVLGLGFATPYLNMFRGEAERVIAAMPAGQGVMHWPVRERGLTMLADETDLPLPDFSMDRVLIVHALECTEQVRPLLREAWRVLADSGRLVVVVPNRRGLWARFESTPLGNGRPYSRSQLSRLLRDNMFMPVESTRALFVPPVDLGLLQGSAAAWEKVGMKLFPAAAGVIMIEAVKQMYAQPIAVEPKRKRALDALPERPHGLNRFPRQDGPLAARQRSDRRS